MDLMDAVKGRRSIRAYKPDSPSQDDLLFILEAARMAPSWANTQCWEFVVVRDAETRQKLSETLPEKNPARGAVASAPVVIVACAVKKRSGYFKGEPVTDKGDWLLFDTALALQNLTLAAHARGLGTVHTGFFDSRAVETLLGVPDTSTVVELLPLGYPGAQGRPTPRKELSDFVYYETYGRNVF